MQVLKRAGFLVRLLCIAATVVCVLAATQGWFERLDVNFWDTAGQSARPKPDLQVVIIAINQRAIHEYGPIPWPPRVMARLVKALDSYQPKVIGLDFIYAGEGERKGEAQAESRPGLNELADACRKSGRVIPGTFFDLDPAPDSDVPAAPDYQREQRIRQIRTQSGASSDPHSLPVPVGTGIHANAPEISAASVGAAHLNLLPGVDGVIRWMPLTIRYRDDLYPSFDVRLTAAFTGDKDDLEAQVGAGRIEGIRIGTRQIATDESGRLLVHFAGGAGSIRYVPVTDVLNSKADASVLKGSLSIVGITSAASGDIWATPESRLMPGVEIHANAVNNLLHGTYLVSNWQTRLITYVGMLVLGVLGVVLLPILRRRGARFIALLALASTLFVFGAAGAAFVAAGYVLGIAAPVVQLLFMFGGTIALSYVTEERYRKQIEHSFRQYLDHNVISEILDNPDRLRLGGERRDLSVLFCDIRGFTTLSEKLPPEMIVSILNDFFTCMSDVVWATDGLVDKFVGDQIMAFWGAPIARLNHALLACQTALDIRCEFTKFAARWTPHIGGLTLNCGVGVNSGPMIVGNIGSDRRFSFTVVGDTVNIAARLESQNKLYSSGILVGPDTYILGKEKFVFRQLDEVRVRGRDEAIAVYELLGRRDELKMNSGWLQSFDDGLRAYLRHDWDKALAHFTAARLANSNDATAAYYIRKLQEITTLPEEKRARSTYLR
jgi:adenylate cyclase